MHSFLKNATTPLIFGLFIDQLDALQNMLSFLTKEKYIRQSSLLDGASIGQHLRHIIECGRCLLVGYQSGIIDYDGRKRDRKIETDKDFASGLLDELRITIQCADKRLLLTLNGCNEAFTQAIETTFYRELSYNTEHAVHHMALIKVALREMGMEFTDSKFGVAPATLKYREACVQ